ncbi:MAG TPA: hypothetical protein VNA69_12150 [Thermoanaerobaculia bacterium]|nr:hypothetical protein [Thermoanaerobaculia bacterium]
MKLLRCTLMMFAISAIATAQTKQGDFELDPLPRMAAPPSRVRSVGRKATSPAVTPCETDICSTSLPHACLEVKFVETAWRTCISNQGRRGLVLGPTDLRRTPTAPWMRVLREAGVGDIFVPYHSLPLRLYDMQVASAASLLEVNLGDAGREGDVVTLSGHNAPQVVAEFNDRGVAWLCKESQHMVRRGRELALWGVFDAQNYDFIMDYRLRDDGSIGFRLGATGFNNPYIPPESTTDAHMHTVLWRVDIDLNGAEGDSAKLLTHREGETSLVSTDVEEPFNGGKEGTAVWDPTKFVTVVIEDEATNAHGNHIGYAIRGMTEGLSRHYGAQLGLARRELFTQFDFAVTRYKATERNRFFSGTWLEPDQYLLGEAPFNGYGVSDAESVMNTDLVLWYRSSVHHVPHDEDHAPGDPSNLMTGITLVHWSGFDLEPHNLFDFNPLGGPSRNNCW